MITCRSLYYKSGLSVVGVGVLFGALSLSGFLLAGCAESSGSGADVTIPIVDLTCSTARCKGVASARAYIVYTTSSCANSAFGETVAGSTTLSCNALGCSVQLTIFTATSGLSATTIQSGFYSVCVVLDYNGNYIGSAVSGEDTTGTLANSYVDRWVTSRSVSSFTDI